MNSKPILLTLAAGLVTLMLSPQLAAAEPDPTWGRFHRLEAVITKLAPETKLAVFTVTTKPRNQPGASYSVHLVVAPDAVHFTPEPRPKRAGSFADLRVGMRVLLSGVQNAKGNLADEILILDPPQ